MELNINRVTLLLGVLWMSASAVMAQNIELRPSAVVNHRRVRLEDIAILSQGEESVLQQLGSTPILEEFQDQACVKVEDVVLALATQVGPRMAEKLEVSGASLCRLTYQAAPVVVKVPTPAAAPVAMSGPKSPATRMPLADLSRSPARSMAEATTGSGETPSANRSVITAASVAEGEESEAPIAPAKSEKRLEKSPRRPQRSLAKSPEIPAGPTTASLAELLSQQAAADLEVSRDEIRVAFETVHPQLDQPTPAGQRWQFRSLNRQPLGTVQWDAQLTSGGHVLSRINIQARVTRHIQVLVSSRDFKRGDVVVAKDLTLEERWIDRKLPTLLTRQEEILGQQALRGIAAGSVMDQRDFRPVEMASRGGPVSVYFLSGPMKIKVQARALESGKYHDSITLRNEVNGEKFQGTLIGANLALVGNPVDETTEKRLREER